MKSIDVRELHVGEDVDVVVSAYRSGDSAPYSIPPAKNGRCRINMVGYEAAPKAGEWVTVQVTERENYKIEARVKENHGFYFREGDRIYIEKSVVSFNSARDSYSPNFGFGGMEEKGLCRLPVITERLKRSRLEMINRWRHKRVEAGIKHIMEKDDRHIIRAEPTQYHLRLNGNELFLGQSCRDIGGITLDDIERQFYGVRKPYGALVIADDSFSVVLERSGARLEHRGKGIKGPAAKHLEIRKRDIPIVIAPKGTPMEWLKRELENLGFETELLEER